MIRKHKPEYTKQVVTYHFCIGNRRKWSGHIKRLITLIGIATIALATLTAPEKTTPSQINNETPPSTEQIAVAEVEKPAIEDVSTESTPIAEEAEVVEPIPVQTHTVTGTKTDWLIAAGIPESDWWAVDYIVSRESGWDPCAYNPGQSDCSANPSSACGLAQSLPCGKQSTYGHWTDPVANLKWQYDYVKGRYGGYAGAFNFWLDNHWY